MVIGIDGTFCSFECAAIFNERCYFVDFDDSVLYSFGLLDGDLRVELSIFERKGTRMFSSMIIMDGIVYLFPFNAENIYRIDLETKEIQTIAFKLPNTYEKSVYAKFFGAYRYGNKIYVLGAAWPIVLEYNTLIDDVNVFSDLGKDLLKYTLDIEEKSFFCKGCIEGKKLYVPYCKGNALIEIFLEDQKYVIHEISETTDGFSCAFADNGNLWMTSRRGGRVYYSECKFHDYKRYDIGTNRDERIGCRFIDIVKINHKIVVTGFLSPCSYEFLEEEDRFARVDLGGGIMWTTITGDGELLMCSLDSGKVLLLGEKKENSFRLKKYGRKDPGLMKENSLDTLNDYLKDLIVGV